MHGDDITSDAAGEDCYRFVKAAGRFLVVKRTPGISTTDLVGRMLLCTRNHFIKSLAQVLAGEEGSANPDERRKVGEDMKQRIRDYATDESGLQPGPQVVTWKGSEGEEFDGIMQDGGLFHGLVAGKSPQPGQRIVYVDGGFDLFSSGHIEFLRQVGLAEEVIARKTGWYDNANKTYPPAFIVAGVHDDGVINYWKGVNYPIMNIFERGLCVIQCRVGITKLLLSHDAHGHSTFMRLFSRLPSHQPKLFFRACPSVCPMQSTMDQHPSCLLHTIPTWQPKI